MTNRKKVILVGRGPSAQYVPVSDDYIIVALNNAVALCEAADYLFLHDLEAMDVLTPENIAKVDTLVLPAHPWLNERQYPDFTYTDFLRNAPGFKRFEVYEGRLEFPGIEPFPWLDRFENVYSSGDAAVAWLLHQGYRDFVFVGIDPGGGHAKPLRDMSKKLRVQQTVSFDCPSCGSNSDLNIEMKHLDELENAPSWYGQQYESLTQKIKNAGGTYTHLRELPAAQTG